MRLRSIIIAGALMLGAGAAHAQDAALERVQNLINTGRLTDARNNLAQWERTQGLPTSNATPADRARALYLTGVLSQDPADAENAFVGVVLSYPSSAVAPEALLRLGQSTFTAGDNGRAIGYLQRLQSDYPPSTARETGALWLARAQAAEGLNDYACNTARTGVVATSNPNLKTLLELERDRACALASTQPAQTRAQPQPAGTTVRMGEPPAPPAAPAQGSVPVRAGTPPPAAPTPSVFADLGVAVDSNGREPEPAGTPASGEAQRRDVPAAPADSRIEMSRADTERTVQRAAADTDTGEFAVQTAAFSQRQAADRIAAELREKGFDARIVTVPGSPLFRVRYGVFGTSREAAAAALHVRDAGFATLVVSDVRLERKQ